jgi:hypothetical protein
MRAFTSISKPIPTGLKPPFHRLERMSGMRSKSSVRNRPRIGRARENGMRSVSRITRIAVAASLALSAAFSAIAAIGFAGRADTGISGSSATSTTKKPTGGARVALPPTEDPIALSPPIAPPISQPVTQAPPPVTSGGS